MGVKRFQGEGEGGKKNLFRFFKSEFMFLFDVFVPNLMYRTSCLLHSETIFKAAVINICIQLQWRRNLFGLNCRLSVKENLNF